MTNAPIHAVRGITMIASRKNAKSALNTVLHAAITISALAVGPLKIEF